MQISEGFQWSSATDREEHFFKISTSKTWDKSEISIRGVSFSSHKPWGKYSIRKRGGEVMLNLFSSTESRGKCRKAFFCFLCSVTLRGQPHLPALVTYGASVASVVMSNTHTSYYVGNAWLITANIRMDFKKQVLYQNARFWPLIYSQNESLQHKDFLDVCYVSLMKEGSIHSYYSILSYIIVFLVYYFSDVTSLPISETELCKPRAGLRWTAFRLPYPLVGEQKSSFSENHWSEQLSWQRIQKRKMKQVETVWKLHCAWLGLENSLSYQPFWFVLLSL